MPTDAADRGPAAEEMPDGVGGTFERCAAKSDRTTAELVATVDETAPCRGSDVVRWDGSF